MVTIAPPLVMRRRASRAVAISEYELMSLAWANPSRVVSTKLPCRSSAGAQAMLCTRPSSTGICSASSSTARRTAVSLLTSSSIIGAPPSSSASCCTRRLRRSAWYVSATAPPWRLTAWATAQAIERELAAPVTTKFLPSRRRGCALGAPSVDPASLVDPVTIPPVVSRV